MGKTTKAGVKYLCDFTVCSAGYKFTQHFISDDTRHFLPVSLPGHIE